MRATEATELLTRLYERPDLSWRVRQDIDAFRQAGPEGAATGSAQPKTVTKPEARRPRQQPAAPTTTRRSPGRVSVQDGAASWSRPSTSGSCCCRPNTARLGYRHDQGWISTRAVIHLDGKQAYRGAAVPKIVLSRSSLIVVEVEIHPTKVMWPPITKFGVTVDGELLYSE